MAAESALLNQLKRESPDDLARLVAGIYTTITDSFVADRSTATRREVTRRFELCLGLVELMVMEADFSISRALDSLPTALRAKLDGLPWEPSKRAMWLGDQRIDVGGGGDDEPLLWTPERQRRGVIVV